MKIKDMAVAAAEITAKTVLAAIPGGAVLSNVYDAVKGGCLDKRRTKWQAMVEERLANIEKTLEDIGNNEAFTTTLVRATEMAMKTASDEKIEYLANAVLNATETALEEEKIIIFLSLLDRYTISHIRTLHYFNNPKKFDTASSRFYMGTPTTLLFEAFPELNTSLFNKIYKDLYQDGLTNLENPNISMTQDGMLTKRTTSLADEFLSFILKQ